MNKCSKYMWGDTYGSEFEIRILFEVHVSKINHAT